MKPALIVHIDRSVGKTFCFKLQLKNSIGQLQSKRRLQGTRKLNEFHRCFFRNVFQKCFESKHLDVCTL